MKNWKTTVGGALGSIGLVLMATNDPKMKALGGGLAAVASLWFGWHAADK